MARGINKVILVGNLGNDPEVRQTQSGVTVTTLSIATTDSWKDKNTGQPQERTEWHRVVLWKRLGEIAGEYLRKGGQVYIEGALRTRKWQDQNGQDRYTTEIIANEMQMLGGGGGVASQNPSNPSNNGNSGSNSSNNQGQQFQTPQQPSPANNMPTNNKPMPEFDGFTDDEIPF